MRLWIILIGAICVASYAHPAMAGCVGYQEVNAICTGSGGCQDEYTRTLCSWGCASGTCVNQGGSGLCCGRIYYNAQIQPDGTRCNNVNCGLARTRTARLATDASKHNTQLWNGARLGTIQVGDRAYRVPRMLFIPDRCAARYGVVLEAGSLSTAGGM